jgi:Holliday junction resolvase RusA-like endonuclease
MIQFTVQGEAVAQGRPRFAHTKKGRTVTYDPIKSRNFKQYVKLVASQHAPKKLIEGPILLEVDVYRSIPKSFSKKKTSEAIEGRIRPVTRPDADNFVKTIKDALSKVIWKDDSQVVSMIVHKWYSDSPRVEITIDEIQTEAG